jgi:hypothetical protein
MAEHTTKNNRPLPKLSGKLAILVGSGLAILNGIPKLDAKVLFPDLPQGITTEATPSFVTRPLPPKLVLKPMGNGYKMIVQHDSHSSHDSHASHDSHSSHDSHASHASHASGGFV